MSRPIAETISIGTEILLGQIQDTHAKSIGERLPALGIDHYRRQTVGDNVDRIAEAVSLALSRSDIVLTIGGLGPTEDDATRQGLSKALGDPLVYDAEIEATIREVFAQRKFVWVESQKRQAYRPSLAKPIPNPNGTAPGLLWQRDGKTLIALPGPRGEFLPMLEGPVMEWLVRSFGGGETLVSRTLRICGFGESVVEERIRHLLGLGNPTIGTYAHPGDVHLRVSAMGPSKEAAERLIAPVEAEIRQIFGTDVYGVDEETLAHAVVRLLERRGETLAVAESLTGGGLGSRITTVPGASAVFIGGFVTYSEGAKRTLLGVQPAADGPVSPEVAIQMAESAREKLGATYALSLTGNAGPDVDRGGKPVGSTYIALASPEGTRVVEHRFRGQRETIRERVIQEALTMLYRGSQTR